MLRRHVTGATKPSASEILDRLEVWGQKLGLDATRSLLDVLGNPQQRVPTVLVAGTNGKGSTSAALASILSAAGLRCGLYTSPHLEHVEERLRIDGATISEAELGHWLRRVLDAAGEAPPTYFESLTAAAWLHFAHHGVDAAVFEVGLGGRLDATNVSDPLLSVITQVARDHAPQLGWTLTSIAGEKAGVMRPGRTCLTWPGRPEVQRELRRCAAVCGAKLVDASVGVELDRLQAPLAGRHQLGNLALAIRAAEEFCALTERELPAEAVRKGVEVLRWPGPSGMGRRGGQRRTAPGALRRRPQSGRRGRAPHLPRRDRAPVRSPVRIARREGAGTVPPCVGTEGGSGRADGLRPPPGGLARNAGAADPRQPGHRVRRRRSRT